MAQDAPKPQLNPAAMPLRDAARLLAKVGGQPVSEEMIRGDIDAGAPTNPDGTLNLVHYVALLVKSSLADRDAGRSLYWLGAIVLMTGVLMMGKR